MVIPRWGLSRTTKGWSIAHLLSWRARRGESLPANGVASSTHSRRIRRRPAASARLSRVSTVRRDRYLSSGDLVPVQARSRRHRRAERGPLVGIASTRS